MTAQFTWFWVLGPPPSAFLLHKEMFDSSCNIDFTGLTDDGQIFKRGKYVYNKKPYGWNRRCGWGERRCAVFTFKSRKFKVLVQSRVNMNDSTAVCDHRFNATVHPENMRPFGLLIKSMYWFVLWIPCVIIICINAFIPYFQLSIFQKKGSEWSEWVSDQWADPGKEGSKHLRGGLFCEGKRE